MDRVVVKIGGDIIDEAARLDVVMHELSWLRASGAQVVLCHGGGPQARALGERLGLTQHKVAGQRVTDSATLEVVTAVLAGTANVSVVQRARARQLPAVGLDGVSAGLIGHRRPAVEIDGAMVEYGLVGDLDGMRDSPLGDLLDAGYLPVVGGLCLDPVSGTTLNVNADDVASEVAVALGARALLLVTAVDGVLLDLDDPQSRVPTIDRARFEQLRRSGAVSGGMVAKLESALQTRQRGVGEVHILAASRHFARQALESPGQRGTVVQ